MKMNDSLQKKMQQGNVLLVETDGDMAAFLSSLVKLSGYEPSFAKDGEQALKMAFENTPDVIFICSVLSKIDALDVAFNPLDNNLYFMASDGNFYRIAISWYMLIPIFCTMDHQ